jgi:hypothetical protein
VFALGWTRVTDRRRAWVTLGFVAVYLFVYVAFRQRVAPMVGAEDLPGFRREDFLPSLVGWLESFWWQTLKRPDPQAAGILALGISLLALRNGRLALGMAAVLLLSGILYWGLFVAYQGALIEGQHFVGRLYLIPFSLFVFVLALDGRRWVLPVLMVPLLIGCAATVRDHLRFQESFKSVYELAATRAAGQPLVVRCAEFPGPLADTRRNLVIGNVKRAEFRLQAQDGRLVAAAP